MKKTESITAIFRSEEHKERCESEALEVLDSLSEDNNAMEVQALVFSMVEHVNKGNHGAHNE